MVKDHSDSERERERNVTLLTRKERERERNVLFNDARNTFYLRLYVRKEGNVLFNDAINTFYLRLYGITHMVKDHSDSEREKERNVTLLTRKERKEGRKCFI